MFDAICALPEYYQTRTEVALLRRHAGEIAGLIGADAEIVEFGAGALRKVRILLDALKAPRGYTPDRHFRRLSARCDAPAGGGLSPAGTAAGGGRLHLAAACRRPKAQRRAGFFPGGTIGNFRPEAAMTLLRRMREMLDGGGLLVGVDLVKDPAHSACRL